MSRCRDLSCQQGDIEAGLGPQQPRGRRAEQRREQVNLRAPIDHVMGGQHDAVCGDEEAGARGHGRIEAPVRRRARHHDRVGCGCAERDQDQPAQPAHAAHA